MNIVILQYLVATALSVSGCGFPGLTPEQTSSSNRHLKKPAVTKSNGVAVESPSVLAWLHTVIQDVIVVIQDVAKAKREAENV